MPFLFVCHSEHTKTATHPVPEALHAWLLLFYLWSIAISSLKKYGKVQREMYIFIAVQALQFRTLVLQQATDMKNSSYFSEFGDRYAADHQGQEGIFTPFTFHRAVHLHQKRLVQLFPKALLHRLRCVPVKKRTSEVKDTVQKVRMQWRVVHLYLWT